MTAKHVPAGFHTVTPYLLANGVAKLIAFLQQAFDAEVLERMDQPDGSVAHAKLRLGDSLLMMGEASAPWSPMPASLYIYVPDADATYQRALQAGGESIMPPADMFYGDRQGGVKDATGNVWWIAQHLEDVSPEELDRRRAAYAKKPGA